MGSEDSIKLMEPLDSADVLGESNKPIVKKRLPKKMRQVPDYYFLPRRSLPSAVALYGAACAAGVGAGMLVEVWINKKIKEDGGFLWENNKS